jgi:hypothetical protein
MSSKLFKTLFAGAVAAGALLLPGTAAQAAVSHDPCDDGPGFGNGAFFGDRFGFPDDGFGFFGDDHGFHRGFHRHHFRDDRPTVIIVTVHDKTRHHKHASTGSATGAGHHIPSATSTGSNDGYKKR